MFDILISIVIENEVGNFPNGGYVNDPDDPGGETKYGISKRSFPNEDIKQLTVDRAKYIYKKYYWDKMNLDLIDDDFSALKLQIFDHGINAGKRTAIRMIQRIVGVEVDGILGINTAFAINVYPYSKNKLLNSYIEERFEYYLNITFKRPRFQKYTKGWIIRVFRTYNNFKK